MSGKSYEEILAENGSFLWKTVGVSMRPLICEGRDFIYIRKRPEGRLKKYDVALFKRPGVQGRGAYVLHRVLRVNPDGTYWIVGDNCFGGETVKEENILGVLDTVIRKGKPMKSDSFCHRAYVCLWCGCWPVRFFILRCKSFACRALRKIYRTVFPK